MEFISGIIFLILSVFAFYSFAKKLLQIGRNIHLGRPVAINDQPLERWKNVFLLALGQKKMFRNIPVALMHLIVYVGFIIINIELLEIIIDGLFGTHRFFAPYLGAFYPFLINSFEVLAALVVIACVVFLSRRNIIRLKRFVSNDLTGWAKTDANLILIIEIVLMSLFLIMNAADPDANFIVSASLKPLFANYSEHQLHIIEQTAWWIHILGIYAFMNYLPYSKHLHIVLAFPNAYYASLEPKGKMHNMVAIQNEVLYAMQPELAPTNAAAPEKFGAKDVMDLSWKNLMDAYSCTECGRCSAACPANSTGKLLSPRKIMMDTRDRLEEVGKNINQNGQFVDDGRTLLNDHITIEELRACTTCNACVEECPVSISPMDIILELRRSLIMEDSNAPAEWNGMFSNIENNFAPWKFAPDDRDAWTKQA
ncbi:MAG: (Fe-S)-binding protein [Sediminibacterium sp.]|nr:(Fe-S)-binding protein [Sediminibacterium sp.]MBP6144583.1 (Fe-S)-binding protein [Sediminibacterium sp.]